MWFRTTTSLREAYIVNGLKISIEQVHNPVELVLYLSSWSAIPSPRRRNVYDMNDESLIYWKYFPEIGYLWSFSHLRCHFLWFSGKTKATPGRMTMNSEDTVTLYKSRVATVLGWPLHGITYSGHSHVSFSLCNKFTSSVRNPSKT